MYYYVFEQPENKKVEKLQEKIRINLEELRIIGEVTKAESNMVYSDLEDGDTGNSVYNKY